MLEKADWFQRVKTISEMGKLVAGEKAGALDARSEFGDGALRHFPLIYQKCGVESKIGRLDGVLSYQGTWEWPAAPQASQYHLR